MQNDLGCEATNISVYIIIHSTRHLGGFSLKSLLVPFFSKVAPLYPELEIPLDHELI